MARYEEPFEEVQLIFDAVMRNQGLENRVNLKVLSDENLKKDLGKVVKANEVTKHLSGVDVVVIINGEIFDGLTAEQQLIGAEELLCGIHHQEKEGKDGKIVEKITINKPDINTYSGLLRKYGYDEYDLLRESVQSLYDAKKNRENGEG